MLFMYETHRVHGARQDDFEHAYRDRWMPAVAQAPGTRLLWYFNHAHGTGVSFNVVTVTAVADWPDWEAHARRVQDGDLQSLARDLDQMRYGMVAKLVLALPWSPLREIDLAAVSTDPGQRHDLQMYVEDTLVPDGGDLEAAFAAVQSAYPAKSGLAELSAAFRPALGAGPRREAILLQKAGDLDALAQSYLGGSYPPGAPWSANHGSVPFTDTWQTRMLRTAEWSPLN